MDEVIIYCERSTPRIEYTLKLVFSLVLGIRYRLVQVRDAFESQSGAKINYSSEPLKDAIQIAPCGLLSEEEIKLQTVQITEWNQLPIFFQTQSTDIPFDLFSAVFYLVTRYEEYLPFIPDSHGRFKADQSVVFRENFLRLPIVDRWCIALAEHLGILQSCKNSNPEKYKFLLTVDIDFPWTYRHKGFFRTTGALLRDFFSLRVNRFSARIKVLANSLPDPGESYSFLARVEKKLKLPIHYFLLCRKNLPYDTNVSVGKKAFRSLMQRLDLRGTVGIHPSYASAGFAPFLVEETKFMSDVLQRMVESSRQHFLRLRFPDTYRNLISVGIKTDFSMGYADHTGFRAGIARSFNFYDLWEEKETDLKIVPFQVMDRTLLSYLNLTPDQAIEEFDYYTKTIKAVGGEMVCLWHNDSLGDWGEWKGWQLVFEKMIEMNKVR
jgi:hypothetical protein